MKKTFINMRRSGLRALVGGFALLALLAFVLPQAAQAAPPTTGTAANAVIRNTVTVNYQDAGSHNMPTVTKDLDITVALVKTPALLSAPVNIPIALGTDAVYNYTITSQANGPDTYTLTTNIDSQGPSISGSTATPSLASVTLGATSAAAAAASGDNSITIPNDSLSHTAGDVNGISNGDTIVITVSGTPHTYTVTGVTDGGTGIGTSTITISGTFGVAIPAGVLIEEQKSFTMTVHSGTVTAAEDETVTVTTTATNTGSGTATDQTVTTFNAPVITTNDVIKEVSATGAAGSWTSSAGTQFKPGDTVYYRIRVHNNGTTDAHTVKITDPQPLYTTYQPGSAKAGTGSTPLDYTSGSLTALNDGNSDGDGYDFGLTTPSVATYNVGTIAAGNWVQLLFTVKVNN